MGRGRVISDAVLNELKKAEGLEAAAACGVAGFAVCFKALGLPGPQPKAAPASKPARAKQRMKRLGKKVRLMGPIVTQVLFLRNALRGLMLLKKLLDLLNKVDYNTFPLAVHQAGDG